MGWSDCNRQQKSDMKESIERVRGVAAISTLASCHSALYQAAIALVLLASFASPTCAFSPANGLGSAVSRSGIHAFRVVDCRGHPSCLFASGDDNVDDGNVNKLNADDGEDDDDVDIITQKLRRNAENGPINPMKEHDKMVKENEEEAKASAALRNNGHNNSTAAYSTLYSDMLAKAVDPDFDPAASMDEAYVESQFKELLSRKGKELSRLGPGIATLPLDPSSDEAICEESLAQKETELQRVIDEAKLAGSEDWDESNFDKSREKQSEILGKANKLQAEIDQMHVDDCGAVLLANLAFYEAFSLQDPEGMRDVWCQSPSVMCIHPSHPPLIGSNAVLDSFTSMFEHGSKGSRIRGSDSNAGASGGAFMTPTNIRGFSVRGTTASLVCDEEVYSKASPGESTRRLGGLMVNKLLTSNVFRKIGGKWKMVHRHASWHPETKAAQEAAKAEPGIALDGGKGDAKVGTAKSRRSIGSEGMTLRRSNGDGMSKRPPTTPSIPSSLEGLDTNAVLGIPMPKEEEPKKPKSEEGMIGKIINLSDLLGGGGSEKDGDKDDDKGIGDSLADMLMDSIDSDDASTTGSGTPEDPFITRRVIKIGPDGIQNRLDALKKDSGKSADTDDDDEAVVIDLRGKSEEERKEALSQVLGKTLQDTGLLSSDDDTKSSVLDASVSQSSPEEDREGLCQKCIATLRKLCNCGQLSSKQKRILLTDIITSSAKGEVSMVEVAYELLVSSEDSHDFTGDSELDTGMEDFAEQCRVFAAMGEE